jgi:hypothetical protein
MTPTDRAALERALAACRSEGPARAGQLDSMLASDPWERVAKFAAYSVQIDSLGLMPWQKPPCQTRLEVALCEPFGDTRGLREAGEILKRLLSLGLSKYEPAPIEAILDAEQQRPARAAER